MTALSRTELLVLARLAVPKPPSLAEIAESLVKLVAPTATKGEWKDRLTAVLGGLQSRSLIDERRRLTDAGRHALTDAFPAKRAPAWKDIRDKHLPAQALGLDASSDVAADGERLQAALLSRRLELPHAQTLAQALDALVAAELGLPPGKVTMDRIRGQLLRRRTGEEIRGNALAAAKSLANSAVRAANGRLDQLRPALIHRWLTSEPISSGGPFGRDPNGPRAAANARRDADGTALPLDDDSFAAMVNHAVQTVGPNGRFGAHKVFVSAIWRNLAGDLSRRGMGLDDLKRRLLDANRAGRLSLARADLIGAMDPTEVKTSEIVDRGARFHFVIDTSRLS